MMRSKAPQEKRGAGRPARPMPERIDASPGGRGSHAGDHPSLKKDEDWRYQGNSAAIDGRSDEVAGNSSTHRTDCGPTEPTIASVESLM